MKQAPQCCRDDYKFTCACTPPCSPGECVNVKGRCPMHCGCAQHGHQRV